MIVYINVYELFVDYNSWESYLKNFKIFLLKMYLLELFLLQNKTLKLNKPKK